MEHFAGGLKSQKARNRVVNMGLRDFEIEGSGSNAWAVGRGGGIANKKAKKRGTRSIFIGV